MYQTAKNYNQLKVLSTRREMFGKRGIELGRAQRNTLEEIGMVREGCHTFPLKPSQSDIHMWIDTPAPDLKRHSFYLNGTAQRAGYLKIESNVFRDLSQRINPNFKGVENLSVR